MEGLICASIFTSRLLMREIFIAGSVHEYKSKIEDEDRLQSLLNVDVFNKKNNEKSIREHHIVMTKEYTANCKNVETKIRVCKKM
jgi:hypothetical protein